MKCVAPLEAELSLSSISEVLRKCDRDVLLKLRLAPLHQKLGHITQTLRSASPESPRVMQRTPVLS